MFYPSRPVYIGVPAARPVYRCRVCGAYTEEPVHCGVPAELLLDPGRRTRLSRLMSGLLRHFPGEAGLVLDGEGFVELEELYRAIRYRWRRGDYSWVRREHLEAVAALDPKGRFEVRGGRIRAVYGHSVDVEPRYERVILDGVLYHGTSRNRLPGIMEKGLLPMKRRYVHLTSSLEEAWRRAKSRGRPVVLVVDAARLSREVGLYRAGRLVYLARRVPPGFIVRVLEGK